MFEDNPLLLLFVIMLLGFILCSFLGGSRCSHEGFSNNDTTSSSSSKSSGKTGKSGKSSSSSSGSNYDNYNHYTGESFPSVFYDQDGGSAKIIQTDSGNIISVTDSNGNTNTFKVPSNGKETREESDGVEVTIITTEEASDGSKAQIVTTSDGYIAIRVMDSDDNIIEYLADNTSQPFDDEDSELRGGNNNPENNSKSNMERYQTTSSDSTSTSTVNNSNGSYDAYLPPGIPKSEIPPGDEGLYILKSQVVPPVCPACPAYGPLASLSQNNSAENSEATDSTTTDPNKCPPCPACERCPEPSYACKLIPNYGKPNNSIIPVPVLSAFSTFGM